MVRPILRRGWPVFPAMFLGALFLVAAAAVAIRIGASAMRAEREHYKQEKQKYSARLEDMVQRQASAQEVIKFLGREFPITLGEADELLGKRSMKIQPALVLPNAPVRAGASYFNAGGGDFFVIVFWDSERRLLAFAVDFQ